MKNKQTLQLSTERAQVKTIVSITFVWKSRWFLAFVPLWRILSHGPYIGMLVFPEVEFKL